jgi:hypothetical protein
VQKGTAEWNGMMNIAQFVRGNLTSKQLSKYVIEDCGDDSNRILENILQYLSQRIWRQSSGIEREFESILDDMIPESWNKLVKYGPALVSYFRLEERFLNFRQDDAENPILPFFQGRIQREYIFENGTMTKDKRKGKVKYHAMVLVGMRRVDNKWRLLLQNWWYDMQFVEVSIEYFGSSGCNLCGRGHKRPKYQTMCQLFVLCMQRRSRKMEVAISVLR